MEQCSNEELIEMIGLDAPILADKNITKSKKALAIVGRLIMLSSLEENKKTGYVYRSNADLAADVDTDESTLRRLLRILENRGYVERRAGNRADNRASIYYLNWNKVNDVVPPYVKNSSTPSATPSATPSVEEVLNALSLEINEIKETLKRLEELVATPSSTPSSEKLPPPVIDIVIDKEIDINKSEIINSNDIKDNIEEKPFAIKDKNSEEEMKKKLDKLYDKLYKKDLSSNRVNEEKTSALNENKENPIVKQFTDYVVNDLTKRYLKDKKRYEELENGLKVANMVLSKENFYDNYHTERLSKEEQEKVRTDAEKIINERTNERIGQMKGKAMEERNKRLLRIYTDNFSSSELDNSLYNHSCDDGRSQRIIYSIVLDAKSARLINEDEEEDFKGVCEAIRLTYKERKEQEAEATSSADVLPF